jgi:ABC-type nickel/cobalt efflux system permease component RcnA
MTLSLLLLGFVIGMRHALESDHLAAMATLVTDSDGLADTVRMGAAWGLGHTLTLFVFGSAVLVLDLVMPETLALSLEFVVGIMLAALGADLLWRVLSRRIHVHAHDHADGRRHLHAHSHAGDPAHAHRGHHHRHHTHGHPDRFPVRALVVGLVHGMAGSAALILLTLQTVQSPSLGLLYIAAFGAGSILGMAALSAVIALPLRLSLRGAAWIHGGFQCVVGLATLALGCSVVYRIGWREHLLF